MPERRTADRAKEKRPEGRQVPHKGSSCLVEESQLFSGLEEPRSVLDSAGVRRRNRPDRGRD